jgi:hypothetical protein
MSVRNESERPAGMDRNRCPESIGISGRNAPEYALDVMLNMVMEGRTAEMRAYEDLEDKLKDVIEKLRERIPHSDILDFLKVKDRNQVW